MAASSLGLIQVASFVAEPWVASGALRPLLEDHVDVERQLYLLYPHRRHMEAKLRSWLTHLTSRLPINKAAA